MTKPKCLCTGRTDIRCDGVHCDLAAPPQRAKHGKCVVCYRFLTSAKHRALWSEDRSPSPASAPSPQPVPKIIVQPAKVVPTAPARPRGTLAARLELPCVHLGEETGERRDCYVCGGQKQQPIHACAKHQRCTWKRRLIYKEKNGPLVDVRWCATCADYEERK